MLRTTARIGLGTSSVRSFKLSKPSISTRSLNSNNSKNQGWRREKTHGIAVAVAAGAVVAGSTALWWLLGEANHLFTYEVPVGPGGNEDEDRTSQEALILAKDGSGGAEQDEDEKLLNAGLDFSRERLHRVVADYEIYQSSSTVRPAQRDKTGISQVSLAAFRPLPSHISVYTRLLGLPTHTLTLSQIVGGHKPRELGEMLMNTVISSLADAVSSYDASQSFSASSRSKPYSSDGEGGLSLGYLEALSQQDPVALTFTRDTVRPVLPQAEVGRALKRAYIGTDYRLVYGIINRIAQMSKQQKAGIDMTADAVEITKPVASVPTVSTAIMGMYESDTRVFTVALVGDSRAVLGRPIRNTSPEPIAAPVTQNDGPLPALRCSQYRTLYRPFTLTADQTPSNPEEVARLQSAHPEQQLFSNDTNTPSTVPSRKTYLGRLPVTRGFGCGVLKWTLDFQRTLQDDFLGEDPLDIFLDGSMKAPPGVSPPDLPPQGPHPISSPTFPAACRPPIPPSDVSSHLLTAEPEITSVRIQPGDFVVLGSRGLFECLNSEEIVGLVGVWMEERSRGPDKGKKDSRATVSVHESATYGADDPVIELMARIQKIETLTKDEQARVLKLIAEHGRPRQRRLVDRTELPTISESVSDDPELVLLSRKNDRLNSATRAFRYSKSWKMPEASFVFNERDKEDVAAHVLRNALGGEREDFIRALSLMDREQVSRFLSDVGLTVIFFD